MIWKLVNRINKLFNKLLKNNKLFKNKQTYKAIKTSIYNRLNIFYSLYDNSNTKINNQKILNKLKSI